MPALSSWARRALQLTGARKAPFPADPIEPQQPTLVERPPRAGEWLSELKWDGYRVQMHVRPEVTIWTRNLHDWTKKLRHTAAAAKALPIGLYDGELIAAAGRRDDFETLQSRIAKGSADVTLVLFDVLHLDGVDVSQAPQLDRKELLADVLSTPLPRIALSTHAVGRISEALKATKDGGYEGVVLKRADAPYFSGRSEDWLKIKHVSTEDLAVVGYVRASTMRTGAQVLLLARPGPDGWQYAGRVKSLGEADSKTAAKLIGKRGQPEPTVAIPPTKARELGKDGALWFDPLFVVEVYSRGSLASHLRQASFKAFRMDKVVGDLLCGT